MSHPTIESQEWCFDQVGKNIVPCIHWEYARESQTIRAHVARFAELREELRRRQAAERKAFRQELGTSKKIGRRLQRQLDQLEAFHEALIRDFLGQFEVHFPEYFQVDVDELDETLVKNDIEKLTRDWRVALPMFATTAIGRTVLEPDHFPQTPWMALPEAVQKEIAERIAPSSPDLIRHRPWHDYSESRFTKDSRIFGAVGPYRYEEVVLRIFFGAGNNEEIVAAFRRWLTKYRKTTGNIPPPQGKRTAVTKAWLRRLGEMRLWKAGGSLDGALRLIEAEAYSQIVKAKRTGVSRGHDTQLTRPISEKADEDSVREDIARAARDLRKLFGWVVPKNEMPLSYPFKPRKSQS